MANKLWINNLLLVRSFALDDFPIFISLLLTLESERGEEDGKRISICTWLSRDDVFVFVFVFVFAFVLVFCPLSHVFLFFPLAASFWFSKRKK